MSENIPKITFLVTGGTIDGRYDPPTERKVTRDDSIIESYLRETICPHFDYKFKTIMMIDSRDMTQDHREKIIDAVQEEDAEKIIINHGTTSMIETARLMEEKIPDIKKTIIMVGAVIPLVGFSPSDAGFNLGYAVAQTQNKGHGIYMCMNGHCFTPQEAVKNEDIARFEFVKKAS